MCQNDSFYEHYSYGTEGKRSGKVSNKTSRIGGAIGQYWL